ncbi:hypothetical protein PGT21_013719 [Puccinia graminis f. sp. tritici]|uniref:Myb/SANT-like domain-containing protein n=1 Tax=Puccinia graminis f. sp. tritici TaxID=56615 RepID=A0A5B0M8I5_PUCGR|nr:hypothetical protein PGT21_013719 [Puccinia graminis f. sp. tritici]
MPPKSNSSRTLRAPRITVDQDGTVHTTGPTVRPSARMVPHPTALSTPLITPSQVSSHTIVGTGATVGEQSIGLSLATQSTGLTQAASLTQTSDLRTTQETCDSEIPESQMSFKQKKITCRWTDEDDLALVRCLLDEKAAHPSAANGFKSVSWAQAVIALDGSELANGSKAKDVGTCKSRWQAIKKMYLSFRTVRNMSGAGWDVNDGNPPFGCMGRALFEHQFNW